MYVGRLSRVSSDSMLMPVWRSVGDGFTGKRESDVWVVRAGTDGQGGTSIRKVSKSEMTMAFSEKCSLQFIQNKKSLEIHVKMQFISKVAGYMLVS